MESNRVTIGNDKTSLKAISILVAYVTIDQNFIGIFWNEASLHAESSLQEKDYIGPTVYLLAKHIASFSGINIRHHISKLNVGGI